MQFRTKTLCFVRPVFSRILEMAVRCIDDLLAGSEKEKFFPFRVLTPTLFHKHEIGQ